MHETDCKMLDIDSDTNFIHFLLQEGIMKSVSWIGFMEIQADNGILKCAVLD